MPGTKDAMMSKRKWFTSGTAIYVQDYEEYVLRLAYPEPINSCLAWWQECR
jgi:hypothetical protein